MSSCHTEYGGCVCVCVGWVLVHCVVPVSLKKHANEWRWGTLF